MEKFTSNPLALHSNFNHFLNKFTLNLPQELVATKIIVWTTVVIHHKEWFSFFIAFIHFFNDMNEKLTFCCILHKECSYTEYDERTGLVVSTLIIGLSVPFFGLMMSLIGSLLTMLVTLTNFEEKPDQTPCPIMEEPNVQNVQSK